MSTNTKGTLLALFSVLATLLYIANIFVGGMLNPGYSHARQFASELGKSDAAYPLLFGIGSVLTGAMFFVIAYDLWRVLKTITSKSFLPILCGIFMAIFGINLIFAGVFPLPSPLHGAFGIALLSFLIPWLLIWTLLKSKINRFGLVLQFFATPLIVFTAIFQTGLLGIVDGTNIGLAQRIAASVFFVWLVATSLWLSNFVKR